MSSLGEAFLRVHADTDGMTEEIRAGTKEAADEVEKSDDFEGIVKAADKAGTRAGSSFGDKFVRDANGRLRTLDGKFASEGKKIGDTLGNSIGDEAENALHKKISKFGALLAPDWIKSIAVWIAVLGPPALELAGVLAPAVGVVAGLIPAALGGAVALIALKSAFNGVSQALKDISGPAAKFNADLKKLTPNQREFVLEVKSVLPQLKSFRDMLADNVFQDFNGHLAPVVNNLLPKLRLSAGAIATELGSMGARIADFLAKASTADVLNQIFNRFAQALDSIGNALPTVLDILLKIGGNVAHWLPDAAHDFGTLATHIDTLITNAQKSGALTNFFATTVIALHDIVAIGKDAYAIVADILSAGASTGGGAGVIGFLNELAVVFNELKADGALAEFFDIFNTAFSILGTLLPQILPLFGALVLLISKDLVGDLKDLTPALSSLIVNGVQPLLGALILLIPILNPIIVGIVKLLDAITAHPDLTKAILLALGAYFLTIKTVAIASKLTDIALATKAWALAQGTLDIALDANVIGLFVAAIIIMAAEVYFMYTTLDKLNKKFDILGKIGNFFKGLGHDIAGAFTVAAGAVGNFFSVTVPEQFDSFLADAQTLPKRFYDLVNAIGAQILQGIGEFIALSIVYLRQAGPALIEIIAFIGSQVTTAFANIWHAAEAETQQFYLNLLHDLESLPGKVAGVLESLDKVVTSIFVSMWDGAKRVVSTDIGAIVGFVEALPGRIEKLYRTMYNVGKTLVEQFIHGLEGIDKLIGGVATTIGHAIEGFLNKAIGKINSGINKIGGDFHLHIPNIPMLANGDIVTRPTLAILGERNPEVVVPTDNLPRARQLLNQSGLSAALNVGSPDVHVSVNIGQEPINSIVDKRVTYQNKQTAQQLAFGTR